MVVFELNKIEKIKTEYMLFEQVNHPEDFLDAKECVDVYIEDMDDSLVGIRKSMWGNNFEIYFNGIRNFINILLDYELEDREWYISDNSVLEKHRELAINYKYMFGLIKECMDDDNYQELFRLAEFTHDSYMSNYHYLESQRDSIEYSVRGISYYGGGCDTSLEYTMFFEEELGRIKENKNKVFEKK